MTRLLALDLGTTLGWAVADLDPKTHEVVVLRSGVRHLDEKLGRGVLWLPEMERIWHLAEFIRLRRRTDEIRALAIEHVQHGAGRGIEAAHVYGQLLGVALLVATEEPRPLAVRLVNVRKVKQAAGLHGSATKDDVVAAARARWTGFVPETHDEADARFVALAAGEPR